MQIDFDALPADAGVLQQLLREVVPELLVKNERHKARPRVKLHKGARTAVTGLRWLVVTNAP